MNVAIALYVLVAAVFVKHTLDEGRLRRLPWDGHRLLGVGLAFAWPLLIVISAILVLREMRSKRQLK